MDAKVLFTGKRNVIFFALMMYFLWGSAFPSVKLGYQLLSITPSDFAGQLIFAGSRFFLAGAILLLGVLLIGKKVSGIARNDFFCVIVLGLLMTMLQYIFFYAGLAHTSGVKASILTGTSTFFSVLLAHLFFTNERLTLPILMGCSIGFLGVIIVSFQEGLAFSLSLGESFIIIAAFILALGGIFGKFLSLRVDPTVMTGWQLCIGGGVLFVIGIVCGGTIPTYTVNSAMLMLYLVFISAAAFSLMALLLKYNPVGMVTVFNFSTPVFGAVLSGIFLGDPWIEWKNLVALLLVSLGIYLVTSVADKPHAIEHKQ